MNAAVNAATQRFARTVGRVPDGTEAASRSGSTRGLG